MKRMIALLLAVCLSATCVLPVHATEEEKKKTEENRMNELPRGQGEEISGTDNNNQAIVSPFPGSSSSPSASASVSPQAFVSASPEASASASPAASGSPVPSTSAVPIPDADMNVENDTGDTDASAGSQTPAPLATAEKGAANGADNGGDWNSATASENPLGVIEVILRNALPVKEISVDVVLKKDGNVIENELGVQLEENPEKHVVSFDGLEPGTYHLEVSAAGFVSCAQDIAVGENTETAEIHTGFVNMPGIAYEKGKAHPGVLLIGDVNGDGVISEEDRSLIIDAMSGKTVGSGNLTDLNRDGKTDIVDLQYYAGNRATLAMEKVDTSAALTSSMSPEAVRVNVNDQTTLLAEGDPQALLQGDGGTVKLKSQQNTAISGAAPVEVGFNLQRGKQQEGAENVSGLSIMMEKDAIKSGVLELVVETEDGSGSEVRKVEIVNGTPMLAGEDLSGKNNGRNGQLTVDLTGYTAIKEVRLKITGTEKGASLAEISKVDFLNGMDNRIPEPDMSRPDGLAVTAGNKSFRLTWNKKTNITGYEVELSYGDSEPEIVRAASNSLEIKSFHGEKLVNGRVYQARVRSVNGAWSSPWSDFTSAQPAASSRPDAPDNLKATGGYRCVRMSWKNMEDTDTYNVYYKKTGENSFREISGIGTNRYEINGLEDQTRYEVYVTGVNELGESNPSLHSEALTSIITPAQMPEYKLINTSNGKGKVSAHIVDATHNTRGEMIGSLLDTDGQKALGTVDKDYGSCYQILDWDDGAAYPSSTKGLLFTLDDYYEMSYITFAEPEDIASYTGVSVYYYDQENPGGVLAKNAVVLQRTDANGRKYYLIKLAEPIKANKIRLGFCRGYSLYNITISEVNFYYYDSLEDDILALYADDLHASLKAEVTEETINALQKRLDTKEEKSGEYHPERELLQRELDNARGLLNTDYTDIVQIETKISARHDGHLGFGGLNAWQPLGITAYEGEQIVVYVGSDKLKTGTVSALKLIATQYHAEAGAFASEVATLRVGRNEITIPAIQSLACEGGGALYVQYTGTNDGEKYAVRVSGGAKEPVLNLYGISDAGRRQELVTAYVRELETHVSQQEELHKQIHEGAGEGNKVNRDYKKQDCILGATDIMLDKMMLSVSAEQILAGLGKGSVEEKAKRLNQSLQAMDEMMEFFYHHKGLSNEASAPATDRMPAQHLNIRYMRMFAGAFMYASGNHIGIEWGSVPGLAGGVPVETDANGKYRGGQYFGWGISHEIGHNINQGSYAYAEVTNNYFAQLTKSMDSNDTVRFTYDNVYKKVTSNTVGRASNVFTQLAMYWQLHLAYDRGYNYKMYDSYEAQHEGLFYARVDTYSRNTSLAPGGLKLGGDRDQNIMRLACAAAEKDLTEFFMRWGFVPDVETVSYAGKFPKEERALYYLTDDARVYEIENGVSGSVKDEVVIGSGSTVTVKGRESNEVEISIQCTANPNVILGYEIVRYCYEDGKPVRQVAGFTTKDTCVDIIPTINNRAVSYEVIAVDKFGYRSKAASLGEVRISHDGSHDKSEWTVRTNMASTEDKKDEAREEDPCEPETVAASYKIIDNDDRSTYEGQSGSEDAEITLEFHQVLSVCGLKYTVKSGTPIGGYEIQVSTDGKNWTTVKTGQFESKKGSQTVYFEDKNKDPWVCTYDAAYVRLKAPGQKRMTISEIDVLGPAGDSISFGARSEGTQGAVGILEEDYVYEQEGKERKIPEGSLIFTGSYKGNPAYNVVVIYDENGGVVGGTDAEGVLTAKQIILAKVPENGLLGEVSDGIWIYWIEPLDGQLPTYSKVRAQLYRVDNALTNEGQRLVSDTLLLQIPEKLDKITLQNDTEAENGTAGQ